MRLPAAVLIAGVLALLAPAVLPGAAAAVPAGADGHYADPAVSGATGAWQARVTVAADGFPGADVTSDASALARAAGTSAFLGPATPFGARFGSSRGLPYLTADTARRGPSTTTVTFDRPTPGSGWGFALGDVDADTVRIAATDAQGRPLTGTALADALGWQGAFNYCTVPPRPSSCTALNDLPSWDPATATLTGSGVNSSGATGWFEPTVPLGALSLTFTLQVGQPNYQLWWAALSVPVTGSVEGAGAGTNVRLLEPDGAPVHDVDGEPVLAPVGASGDYTLPAVADGDYVVRVVPGRDHRVVGPATRPVTVRADDGAVAVPAFRVAPTAAPSAVPTSATPTSSAPVPTTTVPSTTAAAPAGGGTIAATGVSVAPLSLVAAALLVTGGTAVWFSRSATTSTGRRRR